MAMTAVDPPVQPGEIIHRPDPGLARGKWEAPSWAFLAVALGAVVVTLLYVLARSGRLPVWRKRAVTTSGASGDTARGERRT